MSLTRVQQISISLDGFATGEGQSREESFGHAGERLHEWMFGFGAAPDEMGDRIVAQGYLRPPGVAAPA